MRMNAAMVFKGHPDTVNKLLNEFQKRIASEEGIVVYLKTTPKNKLYIYEEEFMEGERK